MFEENARVRSLIERLHISQAKFADSMGLSRGVIANIVYDKNEVADYVRVLICEKYDVSPSWLKTGEGDPYIKKGFDLAEEIRDLTKGENPLMAAVLSSLAQMPPQWWDEWSKKLHEEAERIKKKEGV